MPKEKEVPLEMVSSPKSTQPLLLSSTELPTSTTTTSEMGTDAATDWRRHSASEIDGARRNRGQQTHAYDLHKGIAESAMDISLLTANANQLRLLITYNGRSKTYIACITLVIVSLVLQVLVACGVIIIKSQPKSRLNVHIDRLKIATSIGVSIITVINILVASLVVTDGSGGTGVA
ncbi:hypothetical protein quinque_009937 [Culex quinquefasciatus]|uniref:ninjurin-B-like n=1 Tax=Culex pipiens pallens TaxID=42434 RepID=UPI001952ABC7|nr:ninjurin-B-like [Culex pipiens pallens]XP_052564251.1 ninjurin-B-like [Culex pipiens pallens]